MISVEVFLDLRHRFVVFQASGINIIMACAGCILSGPTAQLRVEACSVGEALRE